MEVKDLRALPAEDLAKHAASAGEQLFRIRFQKSMGNLEGLKRLREHKLDIARVKTIERERAIADVASASPAKPSEAPQASRRTERKHAREAK